MNNDQTKAQEKTTKERLLICAVRLRTHVRFLTYTERKNPLSFHRNVLLNSRLDFMCILHDFTCILRDFRRSLLSVMLQ